MRFIQLISRIVRRIKHELINCFYILDAFTCRFLFRFYRRYTSTANKVIFATQYYTPSSLKRQQEILECLHFNLSLPWLSEVVLFCEHGVTPLVELNAKCRCVPINERATYNAMLSYFLSSESDSQTIVIIANSDIFLSDDLQDILSSLGPHDFLCLNRFESFASPHPYMIPRPRPGAVSWSQDTWVFSRSMLNHIDLSSLPLITLGVPSCENSLAWNLYDQGISISNPCLGIRTVHNHASEIRTYGENRRTQGNYAYPRIQTKYQYLAGRRFSPYLSSHEDLMNYLNASLSH